MMFARLVNQFGLMSGRRTVELDAIVTFPLQRGAEKAVDRLA
jgi:hypothetical protein